MRSDKGINKPVAHHRQWFRFNLRTLMLVVALFAVCVGWNVNWIQQRRALLARQRTVGTPTGHFPVGFGRGRGPGMLWLFGEQAFTNLDLLIVTDHYENVPFDAHEEVRLAHRLFPEAAIGGTVMTSMTYELSVRKQRERVNRSRLK